jgi:hypothetical protein
MLQGLGKQTDGILLPTEDPLQCHGYSDEIINHDHHELVMAHLSAAEVSPHQYSCIPLPAFSLRVL